MKTGRKDPCLCGSRKKYKHCCIDAISKQSVEVFDDIEQMVVMNSSLTIDELEFVAQHKIVERNHRPNQDFCGLTSTQMFNWLYSPFSELDQVDLNVPEGLFASPVMRYLSLILDEAMQNEGSIKSTVKGNLPAKLVKQASELLPEFAVAEFESMPSLSEFSGINEDKFNALHYTRILADLAGIIYVRNGRFHVKKTAQKQYQESGITAFFLPMLEASVTQYNWGYFDSWADDIDLRTFWLFMLWRLQSHSSMARLIKEVKIAFPDLLKRLPSDTYFSQEDLLRILIESRFVKRFLQFWGFVVLDPRRYTDGILIPSKVTVQPLLKQSVSFRI